MRALIRDLCEEHHCSHGEKYKMEMAKMKIQTEYIRDCGRNSYRRKCTNESCVAAVSQ